MPDEAEAFVATLPVVKFHGVGPKTAAKMHALGIETGADLRSQTLASLQGHFGKSGSWYYEISRGRDDRPVRPDRERKSSGSERTFPEDLTDPAGIEAGVIEMAEDVWRWCEKTHSRGRTVTVKIKWADFQISTRSRSMETAIATRDKLHEVALDLIRSVFPPPKGIRLSRARSEASSLRSRECGNAKRRRRGRRFDPCIAHHAIPANQPGFRVDRDPRNSGRLERCVAVCEPKSDRSPASLSARVPSLRPARRAILHSV